MLVSFIQILHVFERRSAILLKSMSVRIILRLNWAVSFKQVMMITVVIDCVFEFEWAKHVFWIIMGAVKWLSNIHFSIFIIIILSV